MWQDIEAGRLTEIGYLNGYVSSLAARRGVDAPTNECLLQLVLALERTSRKER
jgi:2-dehydropantoate 2-reductase